MWVELPLPCLVPWVSGSHASSNLRARWFVLRERVAWVVVLSSYAVSDRLNVKAPSPLMTVAVLVAWSILVMIAGTSRVGGHGPNTKPFRFILA